MSSQKPLNANTPCPCGQPLSFAQCCQPVISGDKPAANAEALMRSRYSAHVVVDVDYLIRSWKNDSNHPISRPDIEQWANNSQWLGLTIHQCRAGNRTDTEGWVEFSARSVAKGDEKPSFHRELSYFVKEGEHWFYVDGEPCETGRNETCPCGSGKKFKRCCNQ